MKIKLTEATMVAGEWKEPGYVFDAPAQLAENYIRSKVAEPAGEGGKGESAEELGVRERLAAAKRVKDEAEAQNPKGGGPPVVDPETEPPSRGYPPVGSPEAEPEYDDVDEEGKPIKAKKAGAKSIEGEKGKAAKVGGGAVELEPREHTPPPIGETLPEHGGGAQPKGGKAETAADPQREKHERTTDPKHGK